MISDNDLYSLAVFLGCIAMLLIVLYHFLEVNAKAEPSQEGSKKVDIRAPQGGNKAESIRQ